MDDPELAAIRQQRLAQMQGQYGGAAGGGGGNSEEAQRAKEERMRQQEEAKHSILSQIMDQSARARLNTLKISKPEKAQMVENMICQMAQRGQLMGKLDDGQFVQLLESLNQQMPKSTPTVKFDRRRAALDDSDDDDYGI